MATSTSDLQPPLTARNGRRLKVLAICRISTVHQDEHSLDDQEGAYRAWLSKKTELPYDVEVIASQGSGECLDRDEYRQAIEMVESDDFDLVITEDLGRICRRVHAHIFCETCEDHETRLIALNDFVDTGREDWRLSSFFAVMRHETYNRDTAQRIRRTLRNRFQSGGVVQTVVFGYVKPPGTTTDDQLQKDPAAELIYDEWFRRLEEGASFSEIADWLNQKECPTGPYARSDKWTGPMVAHVTRNPILKGLRVRNRKMSRRVNKTGRRKSVNAPHEELLERHCPHLEFIAPDRYDRVVRLLGERNACYRRRHVNGQDPRHNVPRKRTRWPGQHVYCGICGRMYVFGGHGRKEHLMCSGAREYKCWNSTTVDGPLAARKISDAVVQKLESLEGFDSELIRLVEEQLRQANAKRDDESRKLSTEIARNQRELDNVVRFVRDGCHSPTIHRQLESLEEERANLEAKMNTIASRTTVTITIPSADELRTLARGEFHDLAMDSMEFGRLMRVLIPRIVVLPHRLCDGGGIVLRARFRLCLANLLGNQGARDVLAAPLERTLEVDVFEPCQRARYREQIVALHAQVNPATGRMYTLAEAAGQVGITATAAQRAFALHRLMVDLGIDDPYIPVNEPPDDFPRLKRHKHGRYTFQPLDNAGQL